MDKRAEQKRLEANAEKEIPLEKWGPYLSDRQWGTVREDYSINGDAWNYFPHEHSRSRAYRWGEDGLGGISDYMQNICFAIALWNGKDAILKERLFGLSNNEGNHGEDVKELYYYLDNLPSHFYMKFLYKYPQAAFPYQDLVDKNHARSRQEPEYEILDTGVFNDNNYFDVFVEYAKKTSEDIFIKIDVVNNGKAAAPLTVLPTAWFFNHRHSGISPTSPSIQLIDHNCVQLQHNKIEDYFFYFPPADDLLFTENETNFQKLFGQPNPIEPTKDAFHDAIIGNKNVDALRNSKAGTKFSPVYRMTIDPGKSQALYLRLTNQQQANPFEPGFEELFETRKQEADEFYQSLLPGDTSPDMANIQRQAFAGLLWSKQYYHFDVEGWLKNGDGITPITPARALGRNHDWKYLKNKDVISMPDTWEYPWYASWDSAFHAVAMAMLDTSFAKNQLLMLMREWYMSPAGQLPAYEWNFSDVNPPVHAFAALEVYHTEKRMSGHGDIDFLKKIFQKLIINFTWWVNRKDLSGNSIFEGGFLGLDNIGVFDRDSKLSDQVILEQSDGTSWMGMYALNMMDMALEISIYDPSFEDAATKFYEHFVIIAEALNELGLWNEEDHFFYDVLRAQNGSAFPLKLRSVVGLIPLFAVSIMGKDKIAGFNDFRKRMSWFKDYRLEQNKYLPSEHDDNENILLSLAHKEHLIQILQRFLDESEFLSAGGIRSVSKYYEQHPYSADIGDKHYVINYDPADSTSGLFGGNSNWRGPVWMPINYLFIKALQKYGEFYGDGLKVECPSGSGQFLNLSEVAKNIKDRILHIFQKDANGNRPVYGDYNSFYKTEKNELIQFYEYFHGDSSRGLGASHQTGWSALIVALL